MHNNYGDFFRTYFKQKVSYMGVRIVSQLLLNL